MSKIGGIVAQNEGFKILDSNERKDHMSKMKDSKAIDRNICDFGSRSIID